MTAPDAPLPAHERCVFCSILQGHLPGSFVYQDDACAAFLDLFPVHEGHTLVVPRLHVPDLTSCPPEVAARLFAVCTALAPAIVRATSASAFNVWTANGKAAGQEVPHLHLHVLPRHEGDAFGLRFPKGYPRQASRAELEWTAARVRAAVSPGR